MITYAPRARVKAATDLLEVKVGEAPRILRRFDEIDPFNKQMVGGFICTRADYRYGAMVIDLVDGKQVKPQVIFCTPKIHYPFDKLGRFTFPLTEEILVFDKLDGTNICAFEYRGHADKRFVSYKTRLMPFAGNRRNGKFLSMWRKMLKRYPQIPQLVLASGLSLSFELYGYLNTHLMKYETALDTALLFAIDPRSGELQPPAGSWYMNLPTPELETTIRNPHDLVGFYRKMEETKQAELVETEAGFEGSEGCIWWFKTASGWAPFKCKPADIKAIHFMVGGVSRVAILHAAYRAQESVDYLTYDDVVAVLKEDFPDDVIRIREQAIGKLVGEFNRETELKFKILERYQFFADRGMRLTDHKRDVMRAMSDFFDKRDMHKVFSVIESHEKMRE